MSTTSPAEWNALNAVLQGTRTSSRKNEFIQARITGDDAARFLY